ncbi:MAG TPA: alpha-hydroxy acid oxidase [Tepidisphaeraceae bacterium]|jgi:4-hydroxymandelate oxidase|nr:alpha-hydroxy acid oxidase [Tepidisphaeraceae bacterium]
MAPNPICLSDYQALARERFAKPAWEFCNSGSADEFTVRWNQKAFGRIRIKPRVMVDVSRIDTRITLLGQALPHPILLAPISSHLLAHPQAEVETARGAGAAGAVLVASTFSNRSIEEIAAAATGSLWFQLYVEDDRGKTRELIQRAEAAGCRALCITVDLSWKYARDREDRVADQTPLLYYPNLNVTSQPGTSSRNIGRSRTFSWRDLEWIRSFAKTPVLLKGILNPDDADEAAKSGVGGVIVSNHGGRGLDTLPATIDALPAVADKIAGRIPVLVDGGIRRGTDVLKCLAGGASAVLIGRPYLYGLGVAGADGVRHVVDILRTEFEAAMALAGRTTVGAIDRSALW